jgi:hypothetical protein
MKILLLCLLSIFTLKTVAQSSISNTSKGNGWVSVGIGAAVPTGEYASIQKGNDKAAFAKPGGVISIHLASGLHRNAGILVSLNGFSNSINEQALIETAPANYSDYTITSTSWKAASLLLGGYIQTTLKDAPSFFVKAQAGYAITRSLSYSTRINYPGATIIVIQDPGSSKAFVWDLGVGLNIPVKKGMLVQLSVDYLSMNSAFTAVNRKETVQQGPDTQTTYYLSAFEQVFENVMIQGGLAWRID